MQIQFSKVTSVILTAKVNVGIYDLKQMKQSLQYATILNVKPVFCRTTK